MITINSITVNHYPDHNKPRSSYLKLLELSVKEDPSDDRNTHYLGREYMYYQQWDKCIKTLKKHLSLKKELDNFNYLYPKQEKKIYDINSVLEDEEKLLQVIL